MDVGHGREAEVCFRRHHGAEHRELHGEDEEDEGGARVEPGQRGLPEVVPPDEALGARAGEKDWGAGHQLEPVRVLPHRHGVLEEEGGAHAGGAEQ